MFDLFKKEELNSLKARIAELEEENRKLLLRFEKRDEKTRKTVATKQDVDRQLNEARQKLSSLENELQKLKKESSPELSFRFSESLSGHKLDDVLSMLGSLESKTSALVTIYLEGDEKLENIEESVVSLLDSAVVHLVEKIESPAGKAIFYDANHVVRMVMLPTFPISHSEGVLGKRFNLEPLKKSLEFDKTLVLNAHAGETFAGIMESGTFVEHEIIRSSVMGKHTKGGWSQKRFQSLVEEDVRHHADKVRTALGKMIEKHKDIRYVIAGGEGKLIKIILEGYDYPLVIKSMDVGSNAGQVLREAMAVRVYGI